MGHPVIDDFGPKLEDSDIPDISPKGNTTRREVSRQYAALQILGNRFLPTLASDLKIGRLLAIIRPLAVPLVAERAKIAERIMTEFGGATVIDNMKSAAQQALMAKIQVEQEAYDSEYLNVDIPDRLLVTQDDLPKERSGDDGWQNASQRAALISDLGSLFLWPKE
jgi:hypothetical protein